MANKLKLPIHMSKQLSELPLPSDQWEMIGLEISFKRKGVLGEWATVIWDDMNAIFYVKTNKAIVYPDDVQALTEALSLMKDANGIARPATYKAAKATE